ncbi:MAG: hypothetical protein ACE5IZ_10410 [Dehalococcoidia bacterium]
MSREHKSWPSVPRPPFGEGGPEALRSIVDRAEALGIDPLWVIDRTVAKGVFLEPMTAMAAGSFIRRRSDVEVTEYAAFGLAAHCVAVVRRYIEAGASKFVLRLAYLPDHVMPQLEFLGREVTPQVESP